MKKPLSLKYMIDKLQNMSNEIAFGYNESGIFWTMFYGLRGSGSMREWCGKNISYDGKSFEGAVRYFYKQRMKQLKLNPEVEKSKSKEIKS